MPETGYDLTYPVGHSSSSWAIIRPTAYPARPVSLKDLCWGLCCLRPTSHQSVCRLIDCFGVGYHQFADDTHLQTPRKPLTDSPAARCEALVSNEWPAAERWQVRHHCHWDSSTATVRRHPDCCWHCRLFAAGFNALGVVIDDHLRSDRHVSAVACECMYHARALRHVHRVLSTETAKTIACSIAASRLDYCNSLLFCAPASTVDKLQCAQNVLARVVLQF